MSWRNVVITKRCKLDYKMGYLVIRAEEVQRIFLDEIALLMLENPAVSLTGCLMEALTEKKVKVIFCDSKRSPIAEVVPYHGSYDSSLAIRTQAKWSEETKALAWQRIITHKIAKQRDFLKELGRDREYGLLEDYVGNVEPADATNREGHAAKVYFNALFGMEFTRGADIPINAALNYGYSLLLSSVNREIALNGYLTQIGVFHNNRFNHFNLGSDLMEPFRILVDRMVYAMQPTEFGVNERHTLWELFGQTVRQEGRKQLVPEAIRIYIRKNLDCISNGNTDEMIFYEII